MEQKQSNLPWHLDPINWFIAVGVVVSLVIAWFAFGQSGAAQRDGTYGCEVPAGGGLGREPGPAVDVRDGRVVGGWYFDISTGEQLPVSFSGVSYDPPGSLSLTSQSFLGGSQRYVCNLD